MSYFLYEGNLELNQTFILKGDEAAHLLQSRRVRQGEWIEIQDMSNQRYQAAVETVQRKELTLVTVSRLEPPAESPCHIHLFQALVKDKALDLILQKTTELGVSSISLFHSTHSQRLKKEVDKQVVRWQKICLEACKQSGRVAPPQVTFLDSQDKLKAMLLAHNKLFPTICLMTTPQPLRLEQILAPGGSVNLLIGPEGGWQPGEWSEPEILPVNLGQRVLRSETAAIATISILQYLFGDMSARIE